MQDRSCDNLRSFCFCSFLGKLLIPINNKKGTDCKLKDIRIISEKRITPDFDAVCRLLGCKNAPQRHSAPVSSHPFAPNGETLRPAYEKLLLPVQAHIKAKAALAIGQRADPSKKNGQIDVLYAILTIGGAVSRLISRYQAKEDLMSVMLIDAMADSCLFHLEEMLRPKIRSLLLEEGYGISRRLEPSADLPIEALKDAFLAVEADRTLGLSITSGHMLNPVKSMCCIYELTDDLTKQELSHDCGKCSNKTCILREEKGILLHIESESDGTKCISCPKGSNLLDTLRRNGIYLPAICGGRGTCGKCGIRVKKGTLPVTAEDQAAFSKEELQNGARLSCKAILEESLTISLSPSTEKDFLALGEDAADRRPMRLADKAKEDGCGMAIDIGTTTLAFCLLDLKDGNILQAHTAPNPQRAFGADVISRIQSSCNGKNRELQECIQEAILDGIQSCVNRAPLRHAKISRIAIAANTVMLHLLRGYSCEGFLRHPFTPKTLDWEELPAAKLLETQKRPNAQLLFTEQAKATLFPGILPFVGADITAGLYACGLTHKKTSLFLDLGTNGEMALWSKGRLHAASAPAGPAFEGGNIAWGMGSVPGAICKAAMEEGGLTLKTIGGMPARGICGTGVIEIAAELSASHILDTTGKLSDAYFKEGYPLAKTNDGRRIALTQRDIRELQMAKAAIRAGIELLLLRSGASYEDIDAVFLAGGFGYFLDAEKAASIGILPHPVVKKTQAMGNTALRGALLYLANQDRGPIQAALSDVREISLPNDEAFQECYLRYLNF